MQELSPKPPPPSRAWGAILVAVPLTLCLNVVTFLALHGIAPRASEGDRQTIALPWIPYAIAAHVVPPMLAFAICSLYWKSPRQRVCLAILSGLTAFLWFQYFGAQLLHRDWIGKF